MADATPVYFEIVVIESGGPLFEVGAPQLYGWLRSFRLPGGGAEDARVSVLARSAVDGSWAEYARHLSPEHAQGVLQLLDDLGVPGRELDLEGVADTSDVWANLSVRVRLEGRTAAADVDLYASGFRGRDAKALRGLCRRLFDLAGYAGYDPAIYRE
jgi:hypothetical protein